MDIKERSYYKSQGKKALAELIKYATENLMAAQLEQDETWDDLLRLCILNSLDDRNEILLPEENEKLDNPESVFNEFEGATNKMEFWKKRLQRLEQYDIGSFPDHFEFFSQPIKTIRGGRRILEA